MIFPQILSFAKLIVLVPVPIYSLIAFALFLSAALPAQAGDRLWSAVLIAENVEQPKAPPKELKAVAARLQRMFGYNSFSVIGTDTKEIEDGDETNLKPTKTFWIKLKARHASVKEARGGYLLNLQLFQETRPLVDTVAMIAPDSPLFFRGPMHGKGQVLVVLQVVR